MSYSEHPHMVKCFLTYRKEAKDQSITKFFSNFMSSYLGNSKYDREVKVKEVFYIGDPSKNRFQLKEYEESLDLSNDVAIKNQADDQETLNLLNDYISHLDLRREENRMRLNTLLVIFMLRHFRSNYFKLELKPKYAEKLKEIYYDIIRAQSTILKMCQDRAIQVLNEEKKVPKAISTNVNYLIDTFMHSDIELDPNFIPVDEDVYDEDIEVEGTDAKEVLLELGTDLFSVRLDRIFKPERFPDLSKDMLNKVANTVRVYRKVWHCFSPTVNINILTTCVGLSTSSYDKYKSIVSSELIKLSNENSYEDITAYLLES